MSRIQEDRLNSDLQYEARGVIAQMHKIGDYDNGVFLKVPVYKFLTLDCGKGKEGVPVKFIGPAPCIEDKGEVILDFSKLKRGDFVIHPGLLYRKTAWSSALMTAHLKALQSYTPKDIIKAEKEAAPAIDLGTIDPKGLTKQ